MSAISVGLLKTDETAEWAKYAFGDPPRRVLGHVIIYKSDGRVDLQDIEQNKYKKHILPAVVKTLFEHHQNCDYPDKTSYHA